MREWTDEDSSEIVAMLDSREITRWTRIPYPYAESDEREFRVAAAASRAAGEAASFAIASATGNHGLLGSIGLRILSWPDRRGELGYYVRESAWGRGIAPRAVRLVSGWGFQRLGLERLEIHVDPRNPRSQRVAEKAGFTREGVLRSYTRIGEGARVDMACYSLLPEEL
ncbi:MAG TPA: GNAT family N-acetyltransferase [Thermoleophilaceae bacterium]